MLATPTLTEMHLPGFLQTSGDILCLLPTLFPPPQPGSRLTSATSWRPARGDAQPEPLQSEMAPVLAAANSLGRTLSTGHRNGRRVPLLLVTPLLPQTGQMQRSLTRAPTPPWRGPGTHWQVLPLQPSFLHSIISPFSVSSCHYITLHSNQRS